MSTSRRDLLKYFGAGAIIAPVIGSNVQARLIEVPNVELIKPAGIEIPLDPGRVKAVTITCHYEDGTQWTRNAPANVTRFRGASNAPYTEIDFVLNLGHGSSPVSYIDQISGELPL